MMSFFGADKVNGEYVWNGGERIPPNWRARVEPYDNNKVGIQIVEMYLMNVRMPHESVIFLPSDTDESI